MRTAVQARRRHSAQQCKPGAGTAHGCTSQVPALRTAVQAPTDNNTHQERWSRDGRAHLAAWGNRQAAASAWKHRCCALKSSDSPGLKSLRSERSCPLCAPAASVSVQGEVMRWAQHGMQAAVQGKCASTPPAAAPPSPSNELLLAVGETRASRVPSASLRLCGMCVEKSVTKISPKEFHLPWARRAPPVCPQLPATGRRAHRCTKSRRECCPVGWGNHVARSAANACSQRTATHVNKGRETAWCRRNKRR